LAKLHFLLDKTTLDDSETTEAYEHFIETTFFYEIGLFVTHPTCFS